MSELKPCPFCGKGDLKAYNEPFMSLNSVECEYCETLGPTQNTKEKAEKDWNTRPIEDALQAEIERLKQMLHDEMGQLEIATDLGNKRWLALNDIYENGEKHNSNWCKRKAQEGLGIK